MSVLPGSALRAWYRYPLIIELYAPPFKAESLTPLPFDHMYLLYYLSDLYIFEPYP